MLELILDVRSRGLPNDVLISHNMPHVFEVADPSPSTGSGRRLCVIDPKQHTMSDAVAFMTGAKNSLWRRLPHDRGRRRYCRGGRSPGERCRASSSPSPARPVLGKSTMADQLADALKARGESAEVLPMDGFHIDNGLLIERGLLARKGVPESFDVRGFLDILRAVRAADQEVLVPVFDQSREIAISLARVVSPAWLHHRRGQLPLAQPGQMGRTGGPVRLPSCSRRRSGFFEETWARWRGCRT